jgi:choice-of-anchor B domain-containing protein
MWYRLGIIYFLIVTQSLAFAQLNMTEVGSLDYPTFLSDIWGYQKNNGDELALVSLENGFSVVDISTPSSPVEIYFKASAQPVTWWRDVVTYDKYAYVVTEANEGLYIVDLEALPGTVTEKYYTGSSYPFTSAHNMYIDENGIAYIFGANNGVGGVIMLDLATDPFNPIELGRYNTFYVHDGVVRGDTLWASCINNGFQAVIDVSDKSTPILLDNWNTPNNFAHNCWPSDDGQILYTTDEKPGAYLTSYDVSDINNAVELDRIKSTHATNTIPHNVHFMNDFIYTSYYNDGILIHDVSHPEYMVETGYFDTEPNFSGDAGGGTDDDYWGAWGVYPWLPSGLVIVSDAYHGLKILSFNNTRASFIEGNITDSCGSSLSNVTITILVDGEVATSSNSGSYLVGTVNNGQYDIQFMKTGYETVTIPNFTLTNGIDAALDVKMGETGVSYLQSSLNHSVSNCENELTVTASYGSGTYAYLWSNAETTAIVTDVSGVNAVSVTDGTGCESVSTISISSIPSLSITSLVTGVSCGASDGSIVVNVVSGTSPYSFFWSNDETTKTITGLPASNYSLSVSDNNGCELLNNETLFNALGPSISVELITTVTCSGGANGSIDVSAVGATSSFTFTWNTLENNQGTSSSISGLSGGIYSVEVEDLNECIAIENITVIDGNKFNLILTLTEPTCISYCNGTATVVDLSGQACCYVWNDLSNQNLSTAVNLCAGDYYVEVSNDFGCTSVASITITEPEAIDLFFESKTLPCGDVTAREGAISLTSYGGVGNHGYLWSTNQTSNSITGLAEGIYYVTVVDVNECESIGQDTVKQYPSLFLSTTTTNASVSNTNDGIAVVEGWGGVGVISYEWSNGITNQTITGLYPGDYFVEITDENGCWLESISNPAVVGYDRLSNVLENVEVQTSVYPTPISSKLTIETNFNDYENVTLLIVDITGRALKQEQLLGTKHEVGVNWLPSGVYFVIINKEAVLIEAIKVVKN